MKKVLLSLFTLTVLLNFNLSAKAKKLSSDSDKELKIAYKQKQPLGLPVEMDEVWGWVMQNKEAEFSFAYPISDVGYFAADVDCYGNLINVPDRKKLEGYEGRVHLVIVCDSKSLTHFVLDPKFGIADQMVNDIMKAVEPFDGLNVDYELIPGKDAKNFMRFLEKLSAECHKKGKLFTVCVPARIKTISDDIFPYKKIASISDRVMIMAYDEHWSTSRPGAVASVDWCRKIADYAVTTIPPEKLVMGLPFYGRSWASEKVSQGWYFEGVNRMMNEYKPGKVQYINEVPTVDIKVTVDTEFWFEDAYSIVTKMRLYELSGIRHIAFWRIGQEDKTVWQWIKLN